MKNKKVLFCLLIAFAIGVYLNSDDVGDYYQGIITICFSKEAVGNSTGDFQISFENDIVTTPFGWFNDLSLEYKIIDLHRKYQVKNKEWHDNGRYPMNVFSIETKDIDRVNDLVLELEKQKDILFVELLAIDRVFYTPNDPYISQQWSLTNIQAFAAWDIETGSPDIIIGIIDSGVKWNHPDLQANMWINTSELPGITINWTNGTITGGDGIDNDGNGYIDDVLGWDFYSTTAGGQDNNPFQSLNGSIHGTHVSGCAAAVGDNGVGIAGPAYTAKILATKHSPYNSNSTTIYNGYNGIYYMADTGVHIINCSWGGAGNANAANLAINYATNAGSLVIVAAGNNGTGGSTQGQDLASVPIYPACATNAFTVANTTQNDTKSTSSNYGIVVDISAPGTNIYSTTFNTSGTNTYSNATGTSMASPITAGVAALIKSQNPSMSVTALKNALKNFADPINHLNPAYVGKLGTGRVNAYASVSNADPSLVVSPTYLNFGNIETGSTSNPAFFTITNTSLNNLVINDIVINGNNQSEFEINSNLLPLIIPPTENITFSAVFSPGTPGTKNAYISINYNTSNTPRLITITGNASGTFPIPYLQNFDNATTLSDIDWGGTLNTYSGIFSASGVGMSKALALNVYSSSSTQSVNTPMIGLLSGEPELSFAYRIVNYTTNWNGTITGMTLGLNNVVHIEVSTTGPTGTYSIIRTINNSNHTTTSNFATITESLSNYVGESINIRFRAIRGSGDWFFVLDDVEVYNSVPPPAHPLQAINPIPPNNATNVLISQYLNWSANPVGATSTGYYLFFDTTSPPLSVYTLENITQWIPDQAFIYDTTYYWKIVPFNNEGEAENCPIWTFSTTLAPPYPVTLIAPLDGSIEVSITPTFEWECLADTRFRINKNHMNKVKKFNFFDADHDNLTNSHDTSHLNEQFITIPSYYRLEISTNIEFAPIIYANTNISHPTNTFTLPIDASLSHNTQYYWRIIATNPGGGSIDNTTFHFMTRAIPEPPVLVLPINNDINIPLETTLTWILNTGSQPTSFNIQFDTINPPLQLITGITETYWLPHSLDYETVYFWRVQAVIDTLESPYSDCWAFTTLLSPPCFNINFSSYDFESTDIGTFSSSDIFIISNTGGSDLVINSISISGNDLEDFAYLSSFELPWIIPHSENHSFEVIFSPITAGYKTATIDIFYNIESSPTTILLSGNAVFVSGLDNTNLPLTTTLDKNFPNPFNPVSTISYTLANAGNVTIDIFNIKGQKVRSLLDNQKEVGYHTIVWNGSDDQGNEVSSGIYFYRMSTDGFNSIKRMMLIR